MTSGKIRSEKEVICLKIYSEPLEVLSVEERSAITSVIYLNLSQQRREGHLWNSQVSGWALRRFLFWAQGK